MAIEAPRTLLVLKPSSFGDIVHTLPAVSRLKAGWPGCRISWLVNTEWIPLLEGNPDVDEIIEFPRRTFRGWGGGWRMAQWLRTTIAGRRPDMTLDFQGLLRSAVIGRASGTPLIAGLTDAREGARWLYHRTVESPAQPLHAVDRYMKLADFALSGSPTRDADRIARTDTFPLPAGVPPDASAELADGFTLVHPFARGSGKSLCPNQIEEILLQKSSRRIVLVGRGDTRISMRAGHCLNLVNKTTLSQLIWLVRRASFVVSVDSGPAHLAAALRKPMVAIHSWSDPRKVGPYSGDAWVWKNGTLTQMRDLGAMDGGFFEPRPLRLRNVDIEAIARLATSPSDFSA